MPSVVVKPKASSPVKIDPLLNATIYLDLTKPEDQDYHYVTTRMRSISKNTLDLQRQYKNTLRPILPLVGFVTPAQFEEALSIYENNQVYYQDRIDDQDLAISAIQLALTQLEHWFMLIIEPKPIDPEDLPAWRERELTKINTGYSSYCDPDLHQYIQPLSLDHRSIITQYHSRLRV
jgi:hypothetical protein